MKPGPIQAANGPIAPDASGVLRDADGNPVVSQQRYGLHEINEVLRLNPVANARNKDVVTNEQLIAAAPSELAAGGEQTDLAGTMTGEGGRANRLGSHNDCDGWQAGAVPHRGS